MTRQLAFWNRDNVREHNQPPAQHNRKRSEKRQRTKTITVRLLPAEYAALLTAARRAHVSVAELLRSSAFARVDTTSNNVTLKRQAQEA